MEERCSQVDQMGQVYRNAKQVIAWLGYQRWNSSLALDFAERLYNSFPQHLDKGTEGELQHGRQRLNRQDVEAVQELFMDPKYAREWLALHNFIRYRPYWGRAWIFQEMLLAKRIVFLCGARSATWGLVQAAMQIIVDTHKPVTNLINQSVPIPDQDAPFLVDQDNPHSLHPLYWQFMLTAFEGRHYMKNSYASSTLSNTTERWLELINHRRCLLPHDKIYAIMGIVPPAVAAEMPKTNYDQQVQQVYKQFAKAYVLGTKSLNILSLSHHTDTQHDLPSWVLDWRREQRISGVHDIAGAVGTNSHRNWHSSALSKYPAEFSSDISELSVYGLRYGIVQRKRLEEKLMPKLKKVTLTKQDSHTDPTYPTYVREVWLVEDGFREILEDAKFKSEFFLHDRANTLLRIMLYLQDPERFAALRPSNERPKSQPETTFLVNRELHHHSAGRTVVETDELDLGLAPVWTETGDIVCQFFGLTAAVVLRSLGGAKYKFIGACYVLGKMGDDAIKMLKGTMNTCPEKIEKFTLV